MSIQPTSAPARRFRVVFVDHVGRLSGGELALVRLLPALAEHVDAHVILGEDGPLVGRLEELGISVEVLPLAARLRDVRRGTVTPGGLDLRALASLPRYVLRLARRLRQLRPDLVHTNSLKAALYGGVAGRIARVPVLWHVRDRISDDYLPGRAITLVHAAARVLPTAVVANSQATLATLPPLRFGTVVYNPVVPDSVVAPADAVVRGTAPGLTIGILGRLSPWKGQHLFLDAFAAVFRDGDAQARIIGSAMFGEEEYAASLSRRVDDLGLRDRVEFRGFREDIWAELAELDVLVHASLAEGFGQTVLEGMAAGVPVIATESGGPAELITDGVDGLLVPPNDVAALAEALARLRDDPALRSRLGAAAQRRSLEFTPDRAAERLLRVYASVLERPRRLRGLRAPGS
jgi:glycosyltransferase involved in cell wall biosynthesis